MPTFTDQTLIINRRNLGETDRILTLITKYHGKFSAVAKGVRRPTSKKGGNLDLLNLAELKIAETRSDLAIITEASVINSFENLKKDLSRVGQAYYSCELINELIPEDKNIKDIFNLAFKVFTQLNNRDFLEIEALMKDFEIELLKIAGFWSDSMFKDKRPKSLTEWRRFNKIFIEQIIGKPLKSPRILKSIKESSSSEAN